MERATTTRRSGDARTIMAKGEPTKATVGEALRALDARARRMEAEARRERDARAPVSYTHLTLPTIRLV